MKFLDCIVYYIDCILDYISIVEALYGISCIIIGISITKFRQWNKKHQIKRVLLFQRTFDACFISIPKFKQKILNRERDIAIYDEVILMNDIYSLLKNIDIDVIKNVRGRDIHYDEIQIGGPVSNEYTNLHFNYYLKNIKWIVTEEHLNGYKADKNLKYLCYDFIRVSTDGNEGFLIGEKFYQYIKGERGWSILVRIIDKSDITPKTIHLLFGCGTNGTIGAVDYFVHHYSKILKENKKKPYIGIFEVNGIGKKTGCITWLKAENYIRL